MKKILIIAALALFLGGISATAVVASVKTPATVEQRGDDKKKGESKDEATEKSSDCSKSCEGEKKSDCSKSCGGESKE